MKTKNSKTIWIVLLAIAALIAALSFFNCMNSRESVNYSEFYSVVSVADEGGDQTLTQKEINDSGASAIIDRVGKDYSTATIDAVVFDGYVVEFDLVLKDANGYTVGIVQFTTNYSRQNVEVLEDKLSGAGISFTYTDTNAGSVWSSLLPLVGCVLIAVVFLIIMMQTQGGTKGAMNFAKTNARVNQNLKVRRKSRTCRSG